MSSPATISNANANPKSIMSIPNQSSATPEPRPLVLEAMRRNDDLLEELQMTVSDLSQWLDVFEMGIKSIRS
ncbi:hypothetical protein BGX31_007241 [Mortierella sp. GBA43]|nr:hypothetical protein BGX31_007241 [Mortierella sp. GBA43]